MKKMIPIALALTVAATSTAGAAFRPNVNRQNVQVIVSQAQQQIVQKLCEQYGFTLCGQQQNCPVIKPETKPENKPDQKPDTKPEQKPDVKPEEKPEQKPDVKPEEKPEQTPDTKPEEKPEQTPDEKPEDKPNTDNGTSQSSYAAEVVRLVNAERAKNGLSALSISGSVQAAAQTRAGELKQSFSHTRPNGSTAFTALSEAGVNYRGAGENIAYGQRTPAAVMQDWMNSPGHRANILKAEFTTIGVGYTVVNGTPYWTQMFTY